SPRPSSPELRPYYHYYSDRGTSDDRPDRPLRRPPPDRPVAALCHRHAAVAQPPAVLALAAPTPRRYGARRRRFGRKRHHHVGHPRRYPHGRAGPRVPRG